MICAVIVTPAMQDPALLSGAVILSVFQ